MKRSIAEVRNVVASPRKQKKQEGKRNVQRTSYEVSIYPHRLLAQVSFLVQVLELLKAVNGIPFVNAPICLHSNSVTEWYWYIGTLGH